MGNMLLLSDAGAVAAKTMIDVSAVDFTSVLNEMVSNLFMVALHFIVGLLKWVLIIGSAVALPFVISGLIHLIYK